MSWFDRYPSVPRGGHSATATVSVSFYHLSFRSGSRVAARAPAPRMPTSRALNSTTIQIVMVSSTRNPTTCRHGRRITRTNIGTLPTYSSARTDVWYLSADFALPRDLDRGDQIELALAFAQELTKDELLPYTLAIHEGRDADGREHNPHAHLMVSERRNDGIERSREQWFRRANSEHPKRGGAP
jgi:hypothetical protein